MDCRGKNCGKGYFNFLLYSTISPVVHSRAMIILLHFLPRLAYIVVHHHYMWYNFSLVIKLGHQWKIMISCRHTSLLALLLCCYIYSEMALFLMALGHRIVEVAAIIMTALLVFYFFLFPFIYVLDNHSYWSCWESSNHPQITSSHFQKWHKSHTNMIDYRYTLLYVYTSVYTST